MVLSTIRPGSSPGRGEGFALRAQPRSPKQPVVSRGSPPPWSPGTREALVTAGGEVRTGRERVTRSRPVFVWPSGDCRARTRDSPERATNPRFALPRFSDFPCREIGLSRAAK
jgi:hypothetical protein